MNPAAKLMAAAALLVLVCGCGNLVGDYTSAGMTGLSVAADGSLAVVLYVCGEDITTVDVSRDREGLKETEVNPVVGTYTADAPLDGLARLDLSAPGATWSPSTPLTLEPDRGYLISAGGTTDDSSETNQLYVKDDDLATMTAGGVYATPNGQDLVRMSDAEFVASGRAICSAE